MVLRKLGIGESTLFLAKGKGQSEDFTLKLAARKRALSGSKIGSALGFFFLPSSRLVIKIRGQNLIVPFLMEHPKRRPCRGRYNPGPVSLYRSPFPLLLLAKF
jgi:hypothetical protein